MLDAVATDMENRVWAALSDELSKSKVKMITGAKLIAVSNGVALIIDKEGHEISLNSETIILACGRKTANALAKELAGKVKELYTIGDAKQPRTIRNAISDGYTLAYHL